MRIYKPNKKNIKKHGTIISAEKKEGTLNINIEIPNFKYIKYKLDCGCNGSLMNLEAEFYEFMNKKYGILTEGSSIDIEVK